VLGPDNDDISLIKITGVLNLFAPATVTDVGSGLHIGTFPNAWHWYSVFAVDPNNSQHLIAADGGSNKMVVSTDGGVTWSPDNLLTNLVTNFGEFDFTASCVDIVCFTQATNIAFDPSNGNRIFVGTRQAGIFASLDGGATWGMLRGSNLVPNVSSFFFDEVQNDVIISSYGRGLWKLDLPVNQPPVVADVQGVTINHTPVPITLPAFDPDGDPITCSIVTDPDPSRGSLDMFNPSTCTVTYVPVPSAFGPDSFTFKATDNRGADSNTGTVSIEVK